ncbi:hypothetical protein ACWPM1_05990 [Tsuneonella sp. HG249]
MRIRLELARTPDFPDGSADHGYQLHAPVRRDGLIDETAFMAERGRATAFRFWPDERDLQGYLIRTANGWAISYALGEDDDEGVFHLETHPLHAGGYVTITAADGTSLPFRVASAEPLT